MSKITTELYFHVSSHPLKSNLHSQSKSVVSVLTKYPELDQ